MPFWYSKPDWDEGDFNVFDIAEKAQSLTWVSLIKQAVSKIKSQFGFMGFTE